MKKKASGYGNGKLTKTDVKSIRQGMGSKRNPRRWRITLNSG